MQVDDGQATLAGNRWRARRSYARPLPGGAELVRVWRRRKPAELRARLDGGPLAVWGEDDVLHVLWQGAKARLVTGLQLPLWPVKGADDLWEVSVRVRHLDTAVISITVLPADDDEAQEVERIWHGSRAAPAPPAADPLAGTVTTRTIESRSLGGPREVTIYRPHGAAGPMPLCLLADGQSTTGYAGVLEAAISAGVLPPITLAGLHSDAGGELPDGRTREYVLPFDPVRFGRHLAFAVDEVLPDLPEATCVITAGFSNGAAFALAAADRRPDRIAAAVALSPNLLPGQLVAGVRTPRYLAAGTIEPGFRECARMLAERLTERGVEHVHQEWQGGHDPYWWRVHLVAGLAWLTRGPLLP
ncbi:hypothetical protein GCM10022419_023950 [Nonomuraea rosea]|uniref:Esterase n=1 Tax=Nonomuraea rosea TaxID=638574 RepID=A0ABP6W0T5_9ACTN